ncbi:MAG: hypothetical protein ACUVXA_01580 [Candidatus Jordarchaeum sp.]|uniref:hypothetical protein n=1 Tax=Candidatus Jordarchaeum sp. TaxID=2823881 RepID=UPI004049FFA6
MSKDENEPPLDFLEKMESKKKKVEKWEETPEKHKKRLLILIRSGVFHFLDEAIREQKNLGITDDEIRENVFIGIEMRKQKIHELHNPNPIFEQAVKEYNKLEERLEQLSPQEILEETKDIIQRLTPQTK